MSSMPIGSLSFWLLMGLISTTALAQDPKLQLTPEQERQLQEANDLNDQGVKLYLEGKVREAIPPTERALEISRKILGDMHPFTATSYANLGGMHEFLGDCASARTHYEQALRIRSKVLGEEHADTARSLGDLGNLFVALGDYAVARQYLEQSLKVTRKISGEEHRDTAVALHNLGHVLSEQGDDAAARLCYEQALRICQKVLGEHHVDTAAAHSGLGSFLEDKGSYAAAQAHYEQAITIRLKVLGTNHPDVAQSVTNLGTLLQRQGYYAFAQDAYEKAFKIHSKALGEEHLDTAASVHHLGDVHQLQGHYAAARVHYERSLKIRKKVLGDEHPDTASSLRNLGLLLQAQGEHGSARPYFEQSLKIHRKVLGDEHPNTEESLIALAALEAALGQLNDAEVLLGASRRGVRLHVLRVLPSLSIPEQLAFLDRRYQPGFHMALTLAVLQSGDSSAAARSAAWLVNGKGVAQESLVSRSLLTRDLGDPDSAALAGELLEIRRQLSTLTLSSPDLRQRSARQKRLSELGATEEKLARKLVATGRLSASVAEWVDIEQVRAALDSDAVFIDIARFNVVDFKAKGQEQQWQPAHYAAWIIPSQQHGDVQIVDLGPADAIDRAVTSVRPMLQTAAANDGLLAKRGEPDAERQLQGEFRKVADLVWKPISDKLGAARQLVISPDAGLWLLPWAALQTSDGTYLIEEYSLRFVISGRDLVAKSPNVTTTQPALFADPDFDLGVAEILPLIKSLFPKMALPENDGPQSLAEKHGLPNANRLPATASELRAISPSVETLTGRKPQVYAGRYALETVVKNVHRPPVLVLSTHGFFLPDRETKHDNWFTMLGNAVRGALPTANGRSIENPMLRCGLLLAGCNQKQSVGGDDGVLTGLEICGIDLRGTDLVVLSACETGVGTVRNGEGVAGLRQAFQLAGANSVVATLWPIPDAESARIMNDFFAKLAAGQSKADALRHAQLKRIAARREKYGAAHPYFWAAYTLTGR